MPRPTPLQRAVRLLAWLARTAVCLLDGMAVLAVVAAAALVWRLSQGPLEVGWLVRHAAEHLAPPGRSRPTIGRAALRWQALDGGAGRVVELDLDDLAIPGPAAASAPALAVAHARLRMSPAALLRGQAEPRSIVLDGVRLHLVRDRDGNLALDDGAPVQGPDGAAPPLSMADTIALLRQPAARNGASAPSPAVAALAQLTSITVHDAGVELTDQRLGAVLRLGGADADLQRQPGGGVLGSASGRVQAGPVSAAVTLRAELGGSGAGTRVSLALAPVSPAELARAVPGLAPLAPMEALVQVSATADLSPTLAPRAATLTVTAGAGRLQMPDAAVPFEELALDAAATWTGAQGWGLPDRLRVGQARAVLASPRGGWPTTIGVSGDALRQDGGIRADVTGTLDHLEFADLAALWPAVWGGKIRPWLTENLSTGTARNGRVTATVQAAADGSGLRLAAAEGSLAGDDVSIHWLRPVPPIEHAQAVLTLVNTDVIQIAIPSARQGDAALSNGMVRITGLSVKDQFLALSADVSSTVPVLLVLLKHPRLHLLDRKPIPIQRPAGLLNGSLSVTLPLNNDLKFEDLDIHAKGKLSGLRLGGLVAGRDVDRGDVTVDVTQKGLHAAGQAEVAGVLGAVGVDLDFTDGGPAQVVRHASLAGHATARQLAAAGLDAGGLVGAGQAAIKATYSAHRDGQGAVEVQADLREIALSIAGWTKAAGQPATASAQVALRDDRLAGIRNVDARGSGMEVRGRAEMIGDRPRRLVLDPIHLGPTRARGEIRLPGTPGEPIHATLEGSVLDLGPTLSGGSGARSGGQSGPRPGPRREEGGTSFVADIRFDQVLLAGERGIGAVTAHAESDGRRLQVLQAQSSGREQVRLSILPRGAGRAVSLRAADAGGLLRALDIIGTVDGGVVAMEAMYDDTRPGSPLSGTIAVNTFHVRDVPGIGKLLQALTVYGIGEAMSGPGLLFTQLTAPFRWEGGVLTLREARASSASLGLTTEGRIDTGGKTLDLKGTVVPAYMVNSALGRLPVIGRLFSPERGGGLVAVNYTYRGAIANPSVAVNPLSALTPGFLRGLFKIFE